MATSVPEIMDGSICFGASNVSMGVEDQLPEIASRSPSTVIPNLVNIDSMV
jgi:hypothetical protein